MGEAHSSLAQPIFIITECLLTIELNQFAKAKENYEVNIKIKTQHQIMKIIKNSIETNESDAISEEHREELRSIIKLTTSIVNWCMTMQASGVRMSDGLRLDGADFIKRVENKKIADHEAKEYYSQALDLIRRIIHWYEKMPNVIMPSNFENAAYRFIAMNDTLEMYDKPDNESDGQL